MESERLYAQLVRGEPGWQETAYVAFYPLVYRLLLKSLGHDAEVEELLGDIFVAFFENARRIRTASAIRSYVVSITMNRIRGEIRRRRRRALIFRAPALDGELPEASGTDDPRARAALQRLTRILDELSANERSAFVLRSMEKMAILEVAAALGVSESTAKRWVRRANEHVKKRVSRDALLSDYVTRSGAELGGDDA